MQAVQELTERLKKIGYQVRLFQTAAQARQYLLEAIGPEETVGIGGCMSVKDLGLDQALRQRGNAVRWHWEEEDANAARRAANAADVYLCSANAVTEKGQIVNIDGYGNRLAATLFGPGRVYMIVGKNKLCKDLEAGLDRIKNVACPKNAKRLGLQTPCAVLGRCTDCSSPQRMCKATLVFDRCPGGQRIEVVLVEEELGY